MINPNDVTIEIPLTKMATQTGARKAEGNLSPSGYKGQPTFSNQQVSEKDGYFSQHVAGRRKVAKSNGNGRGADNGEEEILTRMGKFYNKVLDFSIITRYFLYVLPLAILIAIPITVGATVAKEAAVGKGPATRGVRIVWLFVWIEIVWLSLWVSKLFAKFCPSLFQFLCGIVSPGTRKYALVLRSLELPISLSGWALASLATFVPVSYYIYTIQVCKLTLHS